MSLHSFIDKDIVIGCIFCNIVIPLLLFTLISLFFEVDKVFFIYILTTLMPAGSTTAIFAYKYKSGYMFASRLVSASTIISGFTIPLIYLILVPST